MKVLICGGRDYIDAEYLDNFLDDLHVRYKFTQVIHGAQRGADLLADAWAKLRKIDRRPFPADWTKYGNAAGPIRNSQMLKQGKPDLVVAFPGDKGTADMMAKAKKAHVPVIWVETA